jgi:hypothetical protein
MITDTNLVLSQQQQYLSLPAPELAERLAMAQAELRRVSDVAEQMRQALADKMVREQADELLCKSGRWQLKRKIERQVLFDRLMPALEELVREGVIPADEAAKAAYWTEPKPQPKADFRFLPRLRRFGERVAAILDAAIMEYQTEQLIFVPNPPKKASLTDAQNSLRGPAE